MGYTVAVVGATGAVGAQMIKMLEESLFQSIRFATLRQHVLQEKFCNLKGKTRPSKKRLKMPFEGVDIVSFSAGGSTSAKYAPYAVKAGAVVVDNTLFPSKLDVPLVVPEVNAHALDAHNGIILFVQNCSTIQMMVALEPVRSKWGLDRIIVYLPSCFRCRYGSDS